jgi:hypothetical protein
MFCKFCNGLNIFCNLPFGICFAYGQVFKLTVFTSVAILQKLQHLLLAKGSQNNDNYAINFLGFCQIIFTESWNL